MRILTLLLLFGVVTSTQMYAQTGPGGVGTTDGTTTNFMWYKFHEQGLSDNSNISTVTDFSGNGVDLINTSLSGTISPVFQSNALNSLGIARFNNSRMVQSVASFPTSQITTFMVYNTTVDGRGFLSYDANDGSNNDNDYLFLPSGSNLRVYLNSTGGDFWDTGEAVVNTGWSILGHTWSNSNLAGVGSSMFFNGDNVANDPAHMDGATIDFNAVAVFALGGEQDGPDGDTSGRGQEYDGDIAETIVFGTALNPVQRTIVENYLSAKYGIALTVGDRYAGDGGAEGNFDFGVIGIGQEASGTHTSSSSDGLAFAENGTTLDDGDYLFAGHTSAANTAITTDITKTVGPALQARWSRVWYMNLTDADNGLRLDLTLDANDAGVGGLDMSSANISDYVLLYRNANTVGGNWTAVSASSVFNDTENTITFSNLDITGNGTGYYALGTLNATASPLASTAKTWYSFSTGNWSNSATWTLDPSTTPLFVNPMNEIPSENDTVIINSGRTVSLDIDNIIVQSVEVNGTIDLLDANNTNFNVIEGGGVIRMDGRSAIDNFPSGTVVGSGNFADPTDGGTLVVYGTGVTLNQNRVFNNVRIEMNTVAGKTTLGANYTLNGNLRIVRGDFEFDGNANRAFTVRGDVAILANGRLNVANANLRHQFNLYGDFLNEGLANFTNRTGPTPPLPGNAFYTTEASTGIIDLNLLSATQNQTVDCNNTTNFYRIEIDKGSDATYIAYIRATQQSFFNLLGTANDNMDGNVTGDIVTFNNNALGLVSGTVVIESNVIIPVLHRGNGNYCIGSNARLWIDGGTVRKVTDGNGTDAIVPYGVLEISDGILQATGNSGITLRINGLFKVDGGTTITNNIRTSVQGAQNVGGYVQTGGTVTVDAGIAGANGDYYVFSLTYSGNVFNMSGGTLTVRGGTALTGNLSASGQPHGGGIFINSDPGNQNVTGGTVIMESSLNRAFKLTSRSPFYNVIIRNSINNITAKVNVEGGTSGDNQIGDFVTLPAQNLIVLNDLTIETGTTRTSGVNTYGSYLDLCPNNTDCTNLTVGRNLTIGDSGVLDVFSNAANNAGSSTLTFNTTQNGVLYVGDITSYTQALTDYNAPDGRNAYSNYELPFYNMIIDKSGSTLQLQANGPVNDASGNRVIGGNKNVRATLSRLIFIRNQFALRSGSIFNQIDPSNAGLGYSMRIYAPQVEIDGDLFLYEQGVNPTNAFVEFAAGNGIININSTSTSTIGNFVMEVEDDQVVLNSDLYVKRFGYRHGSVLLGTHNLKIDVLDINPEGNNNVRFFQLTNGERVFGFNNGDQPQFFVTSGNKSDGGLSLKLPRITNVDNGNTILVAADPNYDDVNNEYQNQNLLFFPVGVNANSALRYTPAVAYIVNPGTYTGDEYITVRPVDSELKTTDLTVIPANDGILSYYWNVSKQGFGVGEEPTVSWLFQYDDTDADIGALGEASYAPGKVLDGGTYTRSYDGIAEAVKNGGNGGQNGNILGTDPRNIIIFNGLNSGTTLPAPGSAANDIIDGLNLKVFQDAGAPNVNNNIVNGGWGNSFPNGGFLLENANYTAGVVDRFIGRPQIFYSRNTSNQNWTNTNAWSLTRDGSAAGDYPQEGDIAILTRDNGGAGDPGGYGAGVFTINNATGPVTIAELVFDDSLSATNTNWISGCPRVIFDANGGYTAYNSNFTNVRVADSHIGGPTPNESHGAVFQYNLNSSYTGTFPNGDFANFNSYENALVIYEWDGGTGTTTLSSDATEYPMLWFQGGNSSNRIILFPDVDVTVNGRASINGDMLVRPNNSATSRTLTFKNVVNIGAGCCGTGYFQFDGNSGANQTVVVEGNLTYNTSNPGRIELINNSGTNRHKLIAKSNISIVGAGIFNLGTGANSAIELELQGESSNTFTSTATTTPQLYRIIMNKGTTTTNTFSFNNTFNIPNATASFQPIEVLNGLLTLNGTYNSGAGILLANGSSFYLPNTNNILAS